MFFQSSFSDFERECYGPFLKFFPCSVAASPVNVSRAIFAGNFIFLQEIGSFTKVFGFWGGNFWTFVEKVSERLLKNSFYVSRRTMRVDFFPQILYFHTFIRTLSKKFSTSRETFLGGLSQRRLTLPSKTNRGKEIDFDFFSELRKKHWKFGDRFSAVLSWVHSTCPEE